MLLERIDAIREHFKCFVEDRYDLQLQDFAVENPPQVHLGDIALPFPFQLARSLGRAPRQIAEEIVSEIQVPEGVQRMEAAGGGYINLFFKRAPFFRDLYEWLDSPAGPPGGPKIIVEHTNINPNKAAHIGHLRNAILGDTFVRLLRAGRHRVEVQNYIDNTGVQVADVVVGFRYLRNLSLVEVQSLDEPLDHYCWDLYAEVSEWYEEDPSRKRHRQDTLKAIEDGSNLLAELAAYVSEEIVRAHLQTMEKIAVRYDVLPRESEILRLDFWAEAFQLLKENQALYYAEEGANAGCWVMSLDQNGEGQDEDKIIVRSNGTVTYVGKDIAYQLWKFGLLQRDFFYQPFYHYLDPPATVWTTATGGRNEAPSFGRGEQVYNVIDVRQSYLQRVVVQGLRSLGFKEQADNSIHFSYEMVALSPACCRELGIELSQEDQKKPYVEVSGRKGLGVKADDLVDSLFKQSYQEVAKRQPGADEEEMRRIAKQISVGALRYFTLKYTRNSVIAFDFKEALNFEGETGPYLQYSVVRANNIFRKLEVSDSAYSPQDLENKISSLWKDPALEEHLSNDQIWGLLLTIARSEEIRRQAVDTLEIAGIAKHTFAVAQQFNLFYHRHHILSESDPSKRCTYLAVAETSRRTLSKLLDWLGIEVPERM